MVENEDEHRRLAEEAAQQVYDEQESNARATAGTGPRDEDQADELAEEAAAEGEQG